MARRHPASAILLGGLIAGTIDVGAASLINLIDPAVILHVIASGLIGREAAFSGGTGTALVGLLLQWAMSLGIAAIYVIASTQLTILTRRWVTFGLLYGVAIFAVMNFIVVPLSAAHLKAHVTPQFIALNLLAMLLFGLIVSFFAQSGRDSAVAAAAHA